MSSNDVRLSLFSKLLAVSQESKERPDKAENLTDVLEILAVFDGLRPVHTSGGQHFHSESLCTNLEGIVCEFGLTSLRTLVIEPFNHHSPRIPKEVWTAFDEANARDRHQQPKPLWIYRDPAAADRIQRAVDGKMSRSETLGYPKCCVQHESKVMARMLEQFIQGLERKFKTQTQAELIRLLDEDASPDEIDMSWLAPEVQASYRLYPYVKFRACPECLKKKDSPAAKINRQMRDLAFSLSPAFSRDIWHSRYQNLSKDRTVQVSKSDPCPCGSEEKYKRCCGEISG